MAGRTGQNTVRIIGGVWRRRVLSFPDQPGLRPTPDRVRETVFNWLGQTLDGLSVLDLFAGSGAMGFEAASRGARRVTLVEKASKVAASLNQHRQALQMNQVEVVCADALAWLAHGQERFDVIFLDPPFASDLLSRVLSLAAGRVGDGGYLYIECAQWPELDGWEVVRSGRAGVVRYGLLQRAAV